MRRLLGLAVCVSLVSLAGCTDSASPDRHPAPPAGATSSPTPVQLLIPNVVGQNAQVAVDLLKGLGFNNIDLNAVDGSGMVMQPKVFTVRIQTPPAGQRRRPGTKITLGCAVIG